MHKHRDTRNMKTWNLKGKQSLSQRDGNGIQSNPLKYSRYQKNTLPHSLLKEGNQFMIRTRNLTEIMETEWSRNSENKKYIILKKSTIDHFNRRLDQVKEKESKKLKISLLKLPRGQREKKMGRIMKTAYRTHGTRVSEERSTLWEFLSEKD